jgi:hypothetical protein
MNNIETNIFPILNLQDLNFVYDTYKVRNLRREQDEYFQNSDALVRDLSFKLGAPVQKIERGGELFLVIPSDAVGVPEKFSLVRTQVYLEKTASGSVLDFLARNPENDAICLRVIQFLLQTPLRNDKRLWQPAAGMPFFEKTTAQADRGVGRYQGFGVRALVAPSGKIGLCVDVRSKYARTDALPIRLDRLNFRQHKGRVCVYRYGHLWYEIRIDSLSDLNASEEMIRTADRELSLLDYIVQQCEKPIPSELAALPNDAAVVRYRTNRGETRTVPAGLCYPVCDNQEGVARWLHDKAIIPPEVRRDVTRGYVERYLSNLQFKGKILKLARNAERTERKQFAVPDLEFGRGRKLSVRGTPGASVASLDDLGRKRMNLLRDGKAGFFVKEPFRRQYLILPQSIAESWGGQYETDLKRTVDQLYPEGGGYKPEVITYKDRGPRTYRDQGKAICDALGERILESAYALVMLHSTSDRKLREHDALAAMVVRELRKRDVIAAVNHSDMGDECYALSAGSDGKPRYVVRDGQRGRLSGYLQNVALNKILLTNSFWPFVLATPLHADLTIGIDVKNQTAAFAVIGKNGASVNVKFDESRQKEQLLKDQVLTLLIDIIRAEQCTIGRPLNSIVIHRDGRCFQSELDGASAAVEKLKREGVIASDGSLTVLEISKTAPVRLRLYEVELQQHAKPLVQNPQVGTYTIINGNEGFLCSTGRAFPHKGTVQPLHVRCVLQGMPFVHALEDAYALTTLTWTRPEDASRYPVTLKLMDRWLEEEASEFDQKALVYESVSSDPQKERASA